MCGSSRSTTVLHRRLAAIIKYYNVTFSDVVSGGLHVISLAGQDAVLATASRNGKIEPTALYKQLMGGLRVGCTFGGR